MSLVSVRVKSGTRCSLASHDQPLSQREGLIIAVCEEKSTTTLPYGVLAIYCCILGEITVSTGIETRFLQRGDIHIADTQSQSDVTVAARSACLFVAGSAQAWNLHSRRLPGIKRSMTVPIPATYRKNISASKNFLRLARVCSAAGQDGVNQHIHALLAHVDELQVDLKERIARCPGSSSARKRAVLMRLQRAKNLIEASASDDLDISKLALAANYSVGHFITLFRLVFGETPYAALNRQRVANGRCLLGASDMAVGEIAQSSGFSSPSSFTRAMKKHTGKSATEFRMALRSVA